MDAYKAAEVAAKATAQIMAHALEEARQLAAIRLRTIKALQESAKGTLAKRRAVMLERDRYRKALEGVRALRWSPAFKGRTHLFAEHIRAINAVSHALKGSEVARTALGEK